MLPILHTLYYTLHTEHAYSLSYRFLNNVVITTVIEMVEMVEILNGRLGKCSVERISIASNCPECSGTVQDFHTINLSRRDLLLAYCLSRKPQMPQFI